MALVPWRRRERGGLLDLQDRINTMFGELFRGTPVMPWGEEQLEWLPALNIRETDEEVRVTVELPGVDPENVDISLTEGMLTIRGEKKEQQEERKRDYHRIERCYGCFSRTVNLPSAVDADTVEATFKDGVLIITMSKREEAKTRKVKVEVK